MAKKKQQQPAQIAASHGFKDSPLGRIPEEWEACVLLAVVPKAQYGISTSLNDKAGMPVLRMNNLTHGKIDISDIRFSDDPAASRNHKIRKSTFHNRGV